MLFRLHASLELSESLQAQQVESCGSQCGRRAGAITAVRVSIFIELGVAAPVPALNPLPVSHHLQQRFRRVAQAGEKQMGS